MASRYGAASSSAIIATTVIAHSLFVVARNGVPGNMSHTVIIFNSILLMDDNNHCEMGCTGKSILAKMMNSRAVVNNAKTGLRIML